MQKSTFCNEKMVLRIVFIKLAFRCLQAGLSALKKNHQTIEILLMVDFYAFLKCCIFQNFSRFCNSPVFPGKNVKCT